VSTLVWFRVPAESFVLEKTLSSTPGLRAKIQPTVLYQPESNRSVRLLWVAYDDLETLEASIESDDSVRGVSLVAAFEERHEWLFRAELETGAPSSLLTATNAIILSACSQSTAWDVCMLFPDRQTLSRAYETCLDRGSEIHIMRVREVSEIDHVGGTDITLKQYEALTVAHRLGYYEIPSRTSVEEIAEALDISHQALSERLCRGHRNLIQTFLKNEESSSLSHSFGDQLRIEPPHGGYAR